MKPLIVKTALISVTFIGLLILAVTSFHYTPATYDFGWEYGNIAASLVEGQGYAEAFGGSTHLTAWMLPVNTLIYAAIFILFGVKTEAAMWSCVVCSCALWTGGAYYLYRVSCVVSEKVALLPICILGCLLLTNRLLVIYFISRLRANQSFQHCHCLLSLFILRPQ